METSASSGSPKLPLCVDLDGTLVKSDTLHEQLLIGLRSRPFAMMGLPFALLGGRAVLKQKLGSLCAIKPEALPYTTDFVTYLEQEKSQGRKLVLATAADSTIASSVAGHLGLFDEVLASDGKLNLKGPNKAKVLTEKYGPKGFAYAGNSSADIPVWDAAGETIFVNVPKSLDQRVSGKHSPTARFGGASRGKLRSIIKGIRVYQWVKNILVFAPMVLAHTFTQPATVLASILVFIAFSLTASGIYVINDLLDLESDRAHPRKSKRPLASGDLPLHYGLLGPALVVAGLTVCSFISWPTLVMLLIYITVTTGYSMGLKTQPLVDVFILAVLYTLRLFTGGVATETRVSVWLLAFSSFLFLSLAFLKRTSELSAAKASGKANSRRGYRFEDLGVLEMMGVSSAFIASMVLSLYVSTDIARSNYVEPSWLWMVVPLQLFLQCRMWLAAARGYMTDDPIVYAAKDWVAWVVVGLSALVFVAASYGPKLGILL